MARVKVCGITRLEDAELAAELGAWALGFILWPQSPRAVDPAVAAGIARHMRRRAKLVGVFVDPTLEEIDRAAEGIGLTHLQLHGDVGPSFCAEASRRTGAEVIRAFRIGSGADLRDTARFHTHFHLLDARKDDLHGGTGQTWDWNLMTGRRYTAPLIVSGGLTAENVREAITQTLPFAVDVASGTESEPGIKDPDRLRAFLEAADAKSAPRADPVPARGSPSHSLAELDALRAQQHAADPDRLNAAFPESGHGHE